MPTRRPQPRTRPELEQLEDRLAPATLIITPASGFIDPLSDLKGTHPRRDHLDNRGQQPVAPRSIG